MFSAGRASRMHLEIKIGQDFGLFIIHIHVEYKPKSLSLGKISVPSSEIQASTETKSDTKDGKLHFSIAALPRSTNSSMTRV